MSRPTVEIPSALHGPGSVRALEHVPRSPLGRWTARLLLLTLLLVQQPLWAATITVAGGCTLVDAITAANTDAATGGCPAGAGPDTVELTASVMLTAVNNTTTGPNGLPVIVSDVTVDGKGFTIERSGAAPAFRFLEVPGGGTLTLNTVTLKGGLLTSGTFPPGSGGAVLLKPGGMATITDSTIASNSAHIAGGILMDGAGTLSLTNSTVTDNMATSSHGGIYNFGGTATITNSTVSGNTGTALSGGVGNSGTLTLTHSTLSGNSAPALGANLTGTGTATLTGSILGFPTGGAPNCSGVITDSGGNLADDASCGTVPTTLVGLAPTLAANGGPTMTHALIAGSSAIDAAGACGLATDQRGAFRPAGAACDSGAYEFGAVFALPGVSRGGLAALTGLVLLALSLAAIRRRNRSAVG